MSINDKLNELCQPMFRRLTSTTQTTECPVFDQTRGIWMESDDQFRERIKTTLAAVETKD